MKYDPGGPALPVRSSQCEDCCAIFHTQRIFKVHSSYLSDKMDVKKTAKLSSMRICSFNIRYGSVDGEDRSCTLKHIESRLSVQCRWAKFMGVSSIGGCTNNQGLMPSAGRPSRGVALAGELIGYWILCVTLTTALIRLSCLFLQYQELLGLLGEEWAGVFIGRDDGATLGEGCAVIFKKELLFCISPPLAFWLSETPEVPGSVTRTWGNHLTRMCLSVKFLHLASKKRFALFNTHMVRFGQYS
jgi:hypothetical protein